MTAIQSLQDAKVLIDFAIDQIDSSPTVVPSFNKWAVSQRVLAGEAGYIEGPQFSECNNSDIVCLYRQGTAHVSVGGKLKLRRSTNRGLTWSEPIVVAEMAGRDCRNQALGKDPASGRLIGFSRTADNSNVTYGYYKHISEDNGLTWVTSQVTGLPAGMMPFGTIIYTSNGLCQPFYANNHIVLIFSTDGGLTWGNVTPVWNAPQSSAIFTEPTIVAIDENRVVCVMRDNMDCGRYWYRKSSDGGLTWSVVTQARYSSNSVGLAAPANLVLHGDFVFCAWDARSPHWKQFYTKTQKDAFFANPALGWTANTMSGLVTTYSARAATGTASEGEYGYVFQISIAEGILRGWYDSKTGNGQTETQIFVSSY